MVGFLPARREFGIFIRMKTLERFGVLSVWAFEGGFVVIPICGRVVGVLVGFGMLGRIWGFYWNERREDDLVFQHT